MVSDSLFIPERTCWRVARADRAALLVDSAAYFAAALAAMRNARRSILLLGWGFDPRTRLQPDSTGGEHAPDEIGSLLLSLAAERPTLDIRVLIWKSALPISASQKFFPHRSRAWFAGSRVRFELDAQVPMGACHHQKVLVIDDAIAFVGGGDFGVDRWDSTAHLDHDLRRLNPEGDCHDPRHEVMTMVDGAAAQALGALARERWRRGTGETMAAPESPQSDPWPAFIPAALRDIRVAIARTEPAWRNAPGAREIEALHLACIAGARRSLYLENQYFTSPLIAEALAERLAEPDGPEIVLVSTEHSPSYFDQFTMDRTRWTMIERLNAADRYGRFRAYCPQTRDGQTIIVHSKVAVVDDRLMRVGSANLNNRSMGFDTECDLAVEADPGPAGEATRAAIQGFRSRLLSHFLGCAPAVFETALAERGSMIGAIATLSDPVQPRLKPLPRVRMGSVAAFVAAYHLGDPLGPEDSWRPFSRPARLRLKTERLRWAVGARSPAVRAKAEVDQ